MLMTYVTSNVPVHIYTAVAAFQGESISSGDARWLVICVAIIAFVMLLQAAVILGIAVGALKAQKAIMAEVQELKGKAMPLIAKSHELVTDLSPKITKLVDELSPKISEITNKVDTITGHVEHIAALAREKADEFSPTVTKTKETIVQANDTVQDANRKTQAQIKRVDSMISTALDGAARLGVAIEKGISIPGREIAGIVQGVKVGFDTLISGARAFGSGAVGSAGSRTYTRPGPVPVNREPVAPASRDEKDVFSL